MAQSIAHSRAARVATALFFALTVAPAARAQESGTPRESARANRA